LGIYKGRGVKGGYRNDSIEQGRWQNFNNSNGEWRECGDLPANSNKGPARTILPDARILLRTNATNEPEKVPIGVNLVAAQCTEKFVLVHANSALETRENCLYDRTICIANAMKRRIHCNGGG